MATRHSGGSSRWSPPTLTSPRANAALAAFAVAAVIFIGGCASPGEPTARKPPVPAPIADLAAVQSGNRVLLTFAVPQDSVGGGSLDHPPAVEIYRDFEAAPPSGELTPTAPKHSSLLTTIPSELVSRYAERGQFQYSDRLDAADFANHPNSILVYSVRTRVSAKKLSADSNLAALRVYPAPDPISDLKGQVTPTAVALSWAPPQRTPIGPVPVLAGYRIYRAEAQQSSAPTSDANAPALRSGPPSSPSTSVPLSGWQPSPPALQTPLVKIGESDSPNFADAHMEFGKTYVYSVRSVLDYSGAVIESSDSNLLTVTPRDTFPPAAPSGLIGIFVPAGNRVPAYVDLSWGVSPEPDLAGYRVYRSEQAGVLGTPLDNQLLLTPAFRDMNVVSGRRYLYAVTAVDRSGNESSPSAAIVVSVPAVTQPSHD
ncbi:MAG: hypothetical protein WBQ34_17125 [Candidatus Acidiferrales bacterium]